MPRPKNDEKNTEKLDRQRKLFGHYVDLMQKSSLETQANNLLRFLSDRKGEPPIASLLSIKRWIKGQHLIGSEGLRRLASALDLPRSALEGFLWNNNPPWEDIVSRLPALPEKFRADSRLNLSVNLKDEPAIEQIILDLFKSLPLERKIEVRDRLIADTEVILKKLGLQSTAAIPSPERSSIAKMLVGEDLDAIANQLGISVERVKSIALGKPPPPSCNELSLLAAALGISGEEISAMYEAEFGKKKRNGDRDREGAGQYGHG